MKRPASTAGLSATQRCIDLRQRAMFARRPHPIRLAEQMIDNLIAKLNHNNFTACGGWSADTGDGDIEVFQMGGYHRDSRGRKYTLKGGHIISISRGDPK